MKVCSYLREAFNVIGHKIWLNGKKFVYFAKLSFVDFNLGSAR